MLEWYVIPAAGAVSDVKMFLKAFFLWDLMAVVVFY